MCARFLAAPLLPSGFDFHIRHHVLNVIVLFLSTETMGADAGSGVNYGHIPSGDLLLPASTFESAVLSPTKVYEEQVL